MTIVEFLIAGIVVLGSVFGAVTFMKGKNVRSAPVPQPSEMSASGRILFKPFRELAKDLRSLRDSDRPEVRVISEEAAIQAEHIQDQALKLIQSRDKLERMLRTLPAASATEERLLRHKGSVSASEQEAIDAAIEANRAEQSSYQMVKTAIEDIDNRLREAHANLSKIKSKLIIAAASPASEDLDRTELEMALSELRVLETSFEDAREMIEGTNIE